ncbi:MAG TPA: 2-amino-4-hydroxy-6-hydroxymethyldihydropteridine diphosphokinase [Gemmatimonadaceae bacterium]|nr:2-amino-4-hydroxy-6-hydroxymethyldihydropteridine diphosphokinase [Gemmatimonadaceae bacterium]
MRDIAYIALGSNLGDRALFLARARAALGALPDSRIVATSSVEETEPVGGVPQGPYLNQMIALETSLSPRELLAQLHGIERAAGRERAVRWGPRTLDLDIVMFDHQQVSESDLIVPHPELPHRPFWQREIDELRRGGE